MKSARNLSKTSARDRLLTLRSIPGFRNLPLSTLGPFAQIMRECEFEEGDVLIRPGEPIREGYVLLSGRVALMRDGIQVDVLHPPAAVGLLGILAGSESPPGEVVALEPLTAYSVDAMTMLRLYESDFRYIRNSVWIAATIVLNARGGMPFDPASPPKADPGPGPAPVGELDFVDRLIWLADGIWEDANLEAIAEMARNQTEIFYRAGETVWEQGEQTRFMVRIRHGLMSVEREADGQVTSGVVGHDYTAGLFEGFARQPRSYTARAKTDLWVIQSEVDDFLTVLEDHFDMAMTALSAISANAVQLLWSAQSGLPAGNVVEFAAEVRPT